MDRGVPCNGAWGASNSELELSGPGVLPLLRQLRPWQLPKGVHADELR